MLEPLPGSVLFCCDHNAVRSPMAEAIMKRLYGTRTYVQSAGVRSDQEIDGFAITACKEIGVELSRHRTRSFDQMGGWGDDLGSFDLILALSPASHHLALDLGRPHALRVEFWPILDPTGMGTSREERLGFYRQARDMILRRLVERWGPGRDGWTGTDHR
ncbi:low molecular weight phosphatase family protein [Rubellimicrobium sp. CFH 75288]|nr:low molecular weight phosphatase family protein [Rubellimicrobium sp. CFH 75288]NAZ37122.1 low molecular weight phosphatase family protein [Rubellimicrobium sp. CFH 75288]